MKNHPSRDFIAEAIAEYEAMPTEQRSQLLLSILDDQPYLMGFITNLSDDFGDAAHDSLVESTVILINAFVSAGIPVGAIPQAIIEEVIEEKVEAYENLKETAGWDENISDSPKVFEDLRNRALFYSDFDSEEPEEKHNFEFVLNTIVSAVERSVSVEINSNNQAN